jgi:DNA-binding response OmpR family regulator
VPDRSGFRILIVDDDPALARLAGSVLTAHGFSAPAHVTTGAQALLAAARADVLLLDQNLPDMQGREVLAALRAFPLPPAVVMVTAHGSEAFAAEALRAGADDYLIKDAALPTLLPEIVERIRRTRSLRAALANAEHELLRAERRAAEGEAMVTLQHEINNPLMAASAELELLLTGDEPLTGGQVESLETLRTMLERIGEILRRSGRLPDAAEAGAPPAGEDFGGRSTQERGRALLLVPDPATARVIASLLRQANFAADDIGSPDALVTAANAFDVTLVVAAERALPAGLPPNGKRAFKLMVLRDGDGSAAAQAGADAIFVLPLDPGAFARALAER